MEYFVRYQMAAKYKDGSTKMELQEIIDHRKVAKGFLMKLKFMDNSIRWIRLNELRKSAPEMVKDYETKSSEIRLVSSKKGR